MAKKRCSHCGELKPTEHFYRNPKGRHGVHSVCKACQGADKVARRAVDLDDIRTRQRQAQTRYRARHPEKAEEKRAASRQSRLLNIEERRAYDVARYANNRDSERARNAEFYRSNPLWNRVHHNRRRSRKKNAKGNHTVTEIQELIISQHHLCANPYCRIDLRVAKKHLDHKTPLCRGGSNWIDNLQWLCQPCNDRKGRSTDEEWRQKEFLLNRGKVA